MKAIREECKPLLRLLPVTIASLATYRARESKGQGAHAHASGDEVEEGDPETKLKWIMVRYPWQDPVPEEWEPAQGEPTSKIVTDWVKGMFRRTFGCDTLAARTLRGRRGGQCRLLVVTVEGSIVAVVVVVAAAAVVVVR